MLCVRDAFCVFFFRIHKIQSKLSDDAFVSVDVGCKLESKRTLRVEFDGLAMRLFPPPAPECSVQLVPWRKQQQIIASNDQNVCKVAAGGIATVVVDPSYPI